MVTESVARDNDKAIKGGEGSMTSGIVIGVVIAGVDLPAVFRSRSNKNDQRRRDTDSKH